MFFKRGRKRHLTPQMVEEEENIRKAAKLQNETVPRNNQQKTGGYDTDALLTEDEMSVNTIGRNKAKLFSHILNPKNKTKSKESLARVKSEGHKELNVQEQAKSNKSVETSNSPLPKSRNVIQGKNERNSGIISKATQKRNSQNQHNTTNAKQGIISPGSVSKRGARKQPGVIA